MTTNGMKKLLTAFATVGALSTGACTHTDNKRAAELQVANTMLQQKDKGMKVIGGHVAINASDNFRGATQSVNAMLTRTSIEDCTLTKARDPNTGKVVIDPDTKKPQIEVTGCVTAFGPK